MRNSAAGKEGDIVKAYVLHGIGDLRYGECPKPELQPGWALVKVLAAGICSSDIPRIFQKGTYHFPTIPGHEFCGKVEAVAEESDSDWVGKRVGVFPLIPCKKCDSCQKRQYETCSNYDYIGSRRDGGFAEYVVAPVWNLLELPDTVSNIQGALLEPTAVALHAVKRAGIQSGQTVCIVGTGAIGLLAGQWAKLLGAGQVVIKGRSEAKRELVQKCGMEYSVNTKDTYDCVIEAVGTTQALEECLTFATPNGRVVLMGNPDGDKKLPQNVYWSVLRKQLTLTGTWNSSYGGSESDWQEAVQNAAELCVERVVSHILPWDELDKGLAIMRDKTEPFCKIVIRH